jgi:hypothetical protein
MMPPIAPMVPHLSRTVGNGGDWWADGLNVHTRPSLYTRLWIVEGDMLLMYMFAACHAVCVKYGVIVLYWE